MKIVAPEHVDPDWTQVVAKARPFVIALRWVKTEVRAGEYAAFFSDDRQLVVHFSDPHTAFEFKMRFG